MPLTGARQSRRDNINPLSGAPRPCPELQFLGFYYSLQWQVSLPASQFPLTEFGLASQLLGFTRPWETQQCAGLSACWKGPLLLTVIYLFFLSILELLECLGHFINNLGRKTQDLLTLAHLTELWICFQILKGSIASWLRVASAYRSQVWKQAHVCMTLYIFYTRWLSIFKMRVMADLSSYTNT